MTVVVRGKLAGARGGTGGRGLLSRRLFQCPPATPPPATGLRPPLTFRARPARQGPLVRSSMIRSAVIRSGNATSPLGNHALAGSVISATILLRCFSESILPSYVQPSARTFLP